jgi:hypothetical protein
VLLYVEVIMLCMTAAGNIGPMARDEVVSSTHEGTIILDQPHMAEKPMIMFGVQALVTRGHCI